MYQIDVNSLYEEDYCQWLEITLKQIQEKDVDNLDWVHLTEEIEALGREQINKVQSYLIQLLKHLLMYQYWQSDKEYCAQGWAEEIDNFPIELEILIEAKTLKNYCISIQNLAYQKARRAAIKKTGLGADIFPKQCPYSLVEVLDFDFLPESVNKDTELR
jgi:hypothetical protein